MWKDKDDSLDDLEEYLSDEDDGQEEYEYDFEKYELEDDEPRGKSTALKILLVVFILCVVAAVVLFLLRFFGSSVVPKNDQTAVSLTAEPVSSPEVSAVIPNDGSFVVEEPAATPAATPTPTPAPTPEPTPTPPPFPEQYMIPEVEPGDLTAVRSYIQGQLDAIANDDACPHWDSITVNEDCSVFTVVINSVLETDAEIATVGKMLEFSKIYAAHAGTTAKEIRIDTMNRLGQLLWSKTPEG